MTPNDFVLLALQAMNGEIRGKTLAQKRLYFLAVLTGYEDLLDYRPHYYGPYSAVVANALGQLVSLGFVRQERTAYGAEDARGFEVARTDYILTADGREVAAWRGRQHPTVWHGLIQAWARIHEAGDLDYMTLSIAAKVHHLVLLDGVPEDRSTLIKRAQSLGWELSDAGIRKAVRFLEILGLVRLAA